MPLRFAALLLALALLLFASVETSAQAAAADAPPHHHHEGAATDLSGHEGMAMDKEHDASMPGMHGQFGSYPMSRESSGTSWQPEATPMEMLHTMRDDASLMLHGYANVVADRQTGPRGADKVFAESMLMAMAVRPFGPGTLGLRGMVSLDSLMGKSGYPLLFQTGESADGETPLIDRQHPHDAFMELSASYSLPLGADGAAFVYAGLPGEPALGPPTFMHRYSGMRNPEAPITHHWFDSTHVSFGVVTAGASQGAWKLEGSGFNGREPDERRWNIETRPLDSWSTRLTWNPTAQWSTQASYACLKSPEALEPENSVRRLTASASYLTRLAGNVWATTLAGARNDRRGPAGRSLSPAVLLESTLVVADKHTVFGRIEQVDKDELFPVQDPRHDEAFRVRKLSLGYIYDVVSSGPVRWGLRGVVAALRAPSALDPVYGSHPMSLMVFVQARLAS